LCLPAALGVRKLLPGAEALLTEAGRPGALRGEELLGLSLLLGLLGALLGVLPLAGRLSGGPLAFAFALSLGSWPRLRLSALSLSRRNEATRDLPRWMDLFALCLSAGMDFRGALLQVTEGERGVLAEELRSVAAALSLGETRERALLELAERLPCLEVQDFVRGIIQAEKKGAPIAESLRISAVVTRQKRTVRAEELAARASVLLLIPLMMLLGCIFLLLVAPLLLGGLGLSS